jgi:hypothetical protein
VVNLKATVDSLEWSCDGADRVGDRDPPRRARNRRRVAFRHPRWRLGPDPGRVRLLDTSGICLRGREERRGGTGAAGPSAPGDRAPDPRGRSFHLRRAERLGRSTGGYRREDPRADTPAGAPTEACAGTPTKARPGAAADSGPSATRAPGTGPAPRHHRQQQRRPVGRADGDSSDRYPHPLGRLDRLSPGVNVQLPQHVL